MGKVMSIIAFVLSVASIFLGPISAVAGLVLGIVALVIAKRNNDLMAGKGWAIAAIVIGAVYLVVVLIFLGGIVAWSFFSPQIGEGNREIVYASVYLEALVENDPSLCEELSLKEDIERCRFEVIDGIADAARDIFKDPSHCDVLKVETDKQECLELAGFG
jgi:hypothetical protein